MPEPPKPVPARKPQPEPRDRAGPTISAASTATSTSTKSKLNQQKDRVQSERRSTSKKCGLTLPVGRVARQLRVQRFAKRLSISCAIYLTAVVEYLTAEILEVAGKQTLEARKVRMIPRHIQLAIRADGELNRLLEGVTIASGGVPVTFADRVESHKRSKKKGDYDDSQEF